MNILGIDPGLNGAIALYNGKINILSVYEMPTMKASGRGRDVNWAALAEHFNVIFSHADHAFIEKVGARPGQGVSSMFKFGYVAGGVRGLIAASYIPVTMVTPMKWKKSMGLSSSKDAARARASELFTRYSYLFAKKKDDGIAEAALIAFYGYRSLT